MNGRTGVISPARTNRQAPERVVSTLSDNLTSNAHAVQAQKRLRGKVALLTGVEDAVGLAAALALVQEGADIVLAYQTDHVGVSEVRRQAERQGCRCLTLAADSADEQYQGRAVQMCLEQFGRLDILVNHVTLRYPESCLETLSDERMGCDLRAAILSLHELTRAAIDYVQDHNSIINTLCVVIQHDTTPAQDGVAAHAFAGGLTHTFEGALPLGGLRPINLPVGSGPVGGEEVVLSYVLFVSDDASLLGGEMIGAIGR